MSGRSDLSSDVIPGSDLSRSLLTGSTYAATVDIGLKGSGVNFFPQIIRFQYGLGVQNVLWGEFNFGPGYIGLIYQFQFFIENVVQPTVYSIVGGSLPPGLTLTNIGSTAEGEISGTPTAIGTYNFTMRAENIGGATDKDFSIEISGLPIGGFAVL
jgi:hypothetical protein